jgi:hypothetical protein
VLEGFSEGSHRLQSLGHSGCSAKKERSFKISGTLGRVNGVHRRLGSRRAVAGIKKEVGSFQAVVGDPAWPGARFRVGGPQVPGKNPRFFFLTPFLMGLHMTIDGWRPGRDEEGWRLREAERAASRESDEEAGSEEPPSLVPLQPPGLVKAVTRLLPDMEVMLMLTEAEDPPLRRVRAKSKINILYCYGDASGSGFGWCIDLGEGVRYELGEWCESIQEATSNYHELRDLVNAMVRAAQEGRLDGCEVFVYTENQTAEGAYSKGTTGRRSLFELIVMLYKLQIEFDFILHVIWIAGTRMIQQGTEGLSRGEENG